MRPKLATTLTRLVAVAMVAALFAGVTPASAHAASDPLNRGNVIRRAKTWTKAKVPYSQVRFRDGYRRDCSGFISMAWSLPENLVTWRIPLVAKRISKSQLRPGDVLLNYTGRGGNKHVIMFERWANSKKTAYIGLEQTGARGVDKAVRRTIPYPYFTSKGRYKPWRYKNMDSYWKRIPKKDRQPVHGYRGPIKSPEKLKAEARAAAQAAAKKQAAKLAAERAKQKAAAEAIAKSAAMRDAQVAASVLASPAEKPAAASARSTDKARGRSLNARLVRAGTRSDLAIVRVLEKLNLAPETTPAR